MTVCLNTSTFSSFKINTDGSELIGPSPLRYKYE